MTVAKCVELCIPEDPAIPGLPSSTKKTEEIDYFISFKKILKKFKCLF